jgi:hypothetical protein
VSDIRKALLQALAELSELYPPMRLGQIICMSASLASDDVRTLPGDVDDAALFQATRDHCTEPRTLERIRTALPVMRRHLLAVLANGSTDHPELGKWLCAIAQQAQSNVYDVEDEQLLEVLTREQAVPAR